MKLSTYPFSFCQLLVCISLMFAMLNGCKSVDVQGQIVSEKAIEEINSKKLSKNEVTSLIGTPTYAPKYSPNTWYYIKRSLSKRAWFDPKITEQKIIKIDFDQNGKAIEAKVLAVAYDENLLIEKKHTKTKGTEKSTVQKFIKNIGRFNKTTK